MTSKEIGEKILEYCDNYKIPEQYLIDILIDQKVVPMIRGKATEYAVLLLLQKILNSHEWSVAKLNLNAQTGIHDEDVTITHQRTGIIIKVECKNAVRGSFKYSNRARFSHEPFCSIKCHKSRSDLRKAKTTNDRYLVGDFDIIVSNLSNAVIEGATYTEKFELLNNEKVIEKLAKYYNCNTTYDDIFNASYNDWRFAMAEEIAENGVIPRTPKVLLENDPRWHPITELEEYLLNFTKTHRARMKKR